MIKVSTVTDFDVLDAVRQTAKESPRAMRREADRIARGPTVRRMIARLSREPGPPVRRGRGVHGQPVLRWKSAKQRRKVMAMLRAQGDLPYERDHSIARGWRVVLGRLTENEGIFLVVNAAQGVEYVQGDHTQPYHLDTQWPQAAPIISEFSAPLQDELIDGWYRVTVL